MPESEFLDEVRTAKSEKGFRKALVNNLFYTRGQNPHLASSIDGYMTLAYTVRDHLMKRWRRTVEQRFEAKPRYVYYLSAEYLLGRQLPQNMLYSETTELVQKSLEHYGLDLEDFLSVEVEPGLGNGGLGRLAACFLDSLATLDVPCVGYGLRYEFGIFRQSFEDGWQSEAPDDWLFFGSPWEFPQPDDMVPVGFGGRTEHRHDSNGDYRVRWFPDEEVLGEPVHMMVPGYQTETVNLLRLWRARATREFDFRMFDSGDYTKAVQQKIDSENLTKVLYPNDNTPQGRRLRLKQQYFFVACSLGDIVRHTLAVNGDLESLPEKAVIQLNDTHPVVAIPELMRILLDDFGFGWDAAWDITTNTFAYTSGRPL
jgi:starch phosphorylase